MYNQIRKQLVELLDTTLDGLKQSSKLSLDALQLILHDGGDALNALDGCLKDGLSEERYRTYDEYFDAIATLYEGLHQDAEPRAFFSAAKKLRAPVQQLKQALLDDPTVRYEVCFMPYKASMWDSFEAVWEEAAADPLCDAYVVPLPYYDRTPNGSLGELHYEGGQLPANVPIVHYTDYVLAARHPDILYFHNPYDDANKVTSVAPEYYSNRLKTHTDMLVYVPYFFCASFPHKRSAYSFCGGAKAIRNVDKVIAQSERHKELYLSFGCEADKVLSLGSPKIDRVANLATRDIPLPEAWASAVEGREKTILFTATIDPLLNEHHWLAVMHRIAKEILQDKRLGVIFRPHPLLLTSVTSMRPGCLPEYEALMELIQSADNAVVDTNADFLPAYRYSDAMVSDGGSLTYMYYALKKPVLNLLMPPNIKDTHVMVFDHSLCYSGLTGYERNLNEADRNTLILNNTRDYIDLVLANATDERAEACYRVLHEQTSNVGKSGSAIHRAILHELKNSLNQGQ